MRGHSWDTVPNWPGEYSIPYDVILRNKSSGKGGGRRTFITYFPASVWPSACRWKQWMNPLFYFACVHSFVPLIKLLLPQPGSFLSFDLVTLSPTLLWEEWASEYVGAWLLTGINPPQQGCGSGTDLCWHLIISYSISPLLLRFNKMQMINNACVWKLTLFPVYRKG